MPNFSIPLSGLFADSLTLNTIGNNLANLNTTAFKSQSTEFEDLFYQQIGNNGSGDTLQVGVGTKVETTDTNYLQGSINSTAGVATNLALSGNGFFVVQQGETESLTRAGNFQLDQNGNLVTAEGASVLGYSATNGVVNSTGPLTPLSLPIGASESAQATQNIGFTANLDAGASVGTSYPTSVTIYDSLGNTHLATVTYTKTAANTWDYNIGIPAGDYTGAATNATGTLTFNSSGVLTDPAANVAGVTFAGMADGSANLDFTFNLYSQTGAPTLSQNYASSQTNANTQDGFASGIYQTFSADSSGILTAQFSNGQTETVGQVAVATVENPEALTIIGNNNLITTASSGQIITGIAGTGSRGTITDSALELSNVDISTEFANLIVAQRAFEANSKTVTTFDTVTQDTIAMIR